MFTARAVSTTRSTSIWLISLSLMANMPCELKLLMWLPAMPVYTSRILQSAISSASSSARRMRAHADDLEHALVVDLGNDADDLGRADVETDDEVFGISWLTHVAVHSCFTRFKRGHAVRHAHGEAVAVAQVNHQRDGRGGRSLPVLCRLRAEQARIQGDETRQPLVGLHPTKRQLHAVVEAHTPGAAR